MIWVLLSVCSSFLLGTYDFFRKLALKGNAVLPVLFLSTLTSLLIFLPMMLASHFNPDHAGYFWYIEPQNLSAHVHFLYKSILVSASWVLAFFAFKHLPLTIASPIRSSGPLWVMLGGILIFGESMGRWEWIGVITTMISYFFFTLCGKKENISFRNNKWVIFMVMSTLFSSACGLYDKYLILHFDRMAVQSWCSFYTVIITASVVLIFWFPNRHKYEPFEWRATIILIGVSLTAADFIYFRALSYPGSLISIISTVRRSSVIVSFALGAIFFKEKNILYKFLTLMGILLGIGIILYGEMH